MRTRTALAAALLLCLSSAANAAISVSSPVTKNLYVDSVFVSWSTTTTPRSIAMKWTMTAGPFYNASVTQQWSMALTSTSSHSSFSFNPSQIVQKIGTTGYDFTSITPSSNPPDGTYTVQMSYIDASSVSFPSSSILQVQISTATIPPVLTAPATGTMYKSPLTVTYQLPSVPAVSAGNVQLLFTGQHGSSLTLGLASTQTGSFALDTSNITTSATITSASASTLPDDTYSVQLTYSDSQGHAAASTTNTGVIIETATPAPTLTTPVSGGAYAGLSLGYSLPTAPLPGSVKATIDPGGYVVALPDSPLTNTVTVPTPALANGTYTVTLSYQDAAGNAEATASATDVSYHLHTDPPTLLAPPVASAIPVVLTLPDSPLAGTVQLLFSGPQLTTLVLADGVTSTTLSPHDLGGSSGVTFASSPSLLDGQYTVIAQYQDVDGHAAAQSAPVSIIVDTFTLPPTFLQPVGGTSGLSIPISYTLPEQPLPGSVKLELAGPVHATAIMVDQFAVSTFYIDASTHTPTAPFVQMTGFPLVPGTYTLILTYQDSFGNPASLAIASPVTLSALSFSIADATVNEAAGTVDVPITLSGGSSASVSYATVNGTASAATDYTATSGTLSWTTGDPAIKHISIPIIDNHLDGANRAFSVVLSSPSGGVLARSSATVTIIEDDSPPTLAIANANVNETAGTATMIVTMSGHSGQAVTVHYATSDGSAQAGVQYTTTEGDLTWSAGETGDKTLTIPVLDDEVATGNRTLDVTLSSPSHAIMTRTNATLTIADHETASVILSQPQGHLAVREGGSSDTFTLVLSSRPTADVTITPIAGSLLLVAPTAITFTDSDWQTPKTITITGPALGAISADATTVVGFAVASSDGSYDDFAIAAVTVAIEHVAPLPDMGQPSQTGNVIDDPSVHAVGHRNFDPGLAVAKTREPSTIPSVATSTAPVEEDAPSRVAGCSFGGETGTAPLGAMFLVLLLLCRRRDQRAGR